MINEFLSFPSVMALYYLVGMVSMIDDAAILFLYCQGASSLWDVLQAN